MPRITVNVSEEAEEWLKSEADALGVSKARTGGHCIEVMQNTVHHVDLHRSNVNQTDATDADVNVLERVAALEERVRALERGGDGGNVDIANNGLSDEKTQQPEQDVDTEGAEAIDTAEAATESIESSATVASDTRNDDEHASSDDTDGDAIEMALAGWRHGRNDEERAASRQVALEATEWLREAPIEEASRSDVPLDELADADPLDRDPGTLWTEIVREAWQHAADQEAIARPNSRAYKWVGDTENGGDEAGIYDPTSEF